MSDIVNIIIDEKFSYKKELIENIKFDNKTEIIVKYISDFRSTKSLRNLLSCISKNINIDPIWEKRLILIIDELNNNAIEYGTKKGDYNILRIIVNIDNNFLDIVIEVQDKGNGRIPKNALMMEKMRERKKKEGFKEHSSIRGRGLFLIINNLVDELYFKDSKDGGLIVGIKKKLVLKKDSN